LLIKFTEEPKDVETLSDHLNTIGSRHVSTEEALINKAIIDVEIDELTHKESSHLENHSFDLATKTRVPVIKTQNRSLVQENKKIPVKMLKKNIKIKKWFVLFQSQNCTRLYLCFYGCYVIFLENVCWYSWPICFVVLKLL